MFKYVLKRLGLMLLTFSVIMVICFVLIKKLPMPVPKSFGQDLELLYRRREQLGYNKPILVQLWRYVKAIFQYRYFGTSETLKPGKDVWEVFLEKLPPTMIINVYAMILSVPLGLLFGIYAALRKNKWQDHVISTGVMLIVSVPSYVYAVLVQYLLCFKLGWLEPLMNTKAAYFSWAMFKSILAPVLCLSFGSIAGLTRYTRAELTEVLTSDFMLLARTKGLTKRQATVRHAMRNAMVPILPMIVGEFLGIISGSLIIENVFSVPGVGGLYLESINALDYNFFLVLTGFYTIVGLLGSLLVDISYGFIDPRIRMGAR